ncbi:MAG: twitching motility protein PilT [Clostridiales bacterium]|nr:twitching motility protein PilT [Clostridiales bacterium]
MIQVIAGKKGSGKTKRIIDMANQATQESKHDIVFIDDDNRYMFDLRHEVRFINAGEYDLLSDHMFMGFLCGAVAQNFDVGQIYIDAFKKLIHNELDTCEWVFKRMEAISASHSVDFVISISAGTDELPEFIKKYVI